MVNIRYMRQARILGSWSHQHCRFTSICPKMCLISNVPSRKLHIRVRLWYHSRMVAPQNGTCFT